MKWNVIFNPKYMKCYSLTTKAKIILRLGVENSSKQQADGQFLVGGRKHL